MSYQVIARKFRPKSFADLVGQPHISQTLANALKNGRLHHALLFTGPRGTGKTSSARILAKSIRCPNAVDFVPCNQCSECEEIAQGRAINVMEIDGASNNGVDSIRELRESIGFMPSTGRFKVYIIDEVHMLSLSAFNALLKTLEEPPAHVIFIMATTEVQKIPQTILSRCQRFDFRRIPTREIAERLELICKSENVQAESDALWLIARQGDGSMRDGQSLLDQVITFANGPLTLITVVQILGLTDRRVLLSTLEALVKEDMKALIDVLAKLAQTGLEPHLFAQELLETIRHLLLIKIAPTSGLVDMPDSEQKYLQELSQTISEEDIHLLFDMALKGANDIPRAQDPRLVLEMLLLRMVHAPRVHDLRSLLQGKVLQPAATTNGEQKKNLATPSAPPPPEFIASSLSSEDRWLEFCDRIKKVDPLFGSKVEQLLFLGEKEKKVLLSVSAKHPFLKDLARDSAALQKMQTHVDRHWGSGYAIEIKSEADSSQAPSALMMKQVKEQTKKEEVYKIVSEHPAIKAVQDVFKGQITEIKEKT